jgi:serine/threonine protein kinase
MARLRHTGAAMIFDAGRLPDGRPFIVMEFVEGETLADALTKQGRLAPPQAVEIACAICEVLAEAHALGIVHRDLKPSNIIRARQLLTNQQKWAYRASAIRLQADVQLSSSAPTLELVTATGQGRCLTTFTPNRSIFFMRRSSLTSLILTIAESSKRTK